MKLNLVFHFLNSFCFLSQFEFTEKQWDVQRVPIYFLPLEVPSLCYCHPVPVVVPLLQLMNLHWHNIITQSPQFILTYTLGVLYTLWILINVYGMYQKILHCEEQFHCLKNPLCSNYSLSSPNPWQSLNFFLSSYFSILYNIT